MNQLDKLEKRIRALFESSATFPPWADPNGRVVQALSTAIRDLFLNEIPRDQLVSPVFIVYLHPQNIQQLQAQPDWQSTLANLFMITAAEYGTRFHSTPAIELSANTESALDEVGILLKDSPGLVHKETGIISLKANRDAQASCQEFESVPILILDGNRTIQLNRSVINIGRKNSNHIIINDLRVSRNHAQIRRVKDDYVIFDTGSTGGTFINSNRVDKHVLRPGDVISLSGYTMIFTVDQLPGDGMKKGITSEIKSTNNGDENS